MGESRIKLTATFPPSPLWFEEDLTSSEIPRKPVMTEKRNISSNTAGSIICVVV